MNLHISKSKNSESFYIAKSYLKENESISSIIIQNLGTLNQLLLKYGPTRDDIVAWAKNKVPLGTEQYKCEKEAQIILISFRADKQITYDKQVFYRGGYLFLQSLYYQLLMDKICRKLKRNDNSKYL